MSSGRFNYRRARRTVLAGVLLAGTAVVAVPLAQPISAATTTTVVSADEPIGGWDIGRDDDNLAPYEFTSGASSIGAGALHVGPIGNDIKGNADKFILEYPILEPVESFVSVEYDVLVEGATPAADANEFYLNIYALLPGNTPDTTFFNCKYDYVPSTANNATFTTIVASTSTSANTVVASPGGSPCGTSTGDLPPGSTIYFMALNVGDTDPTDQGVAGSFDNVVITTDTDTEIFDFEAPPVEAPTGATTIVVTNDENPTLEQQAAGEPSSGWDIGRDGGFLAPFEFNDNVASVGDGALSVGPITNSIKIVNANNVPPTPSPGADKFISEFIVNELASDFQSISFDILVDDPADSSQFYLNIYANMPGSTSFYECRFDVIASGASSSSFTTFGLTAGGTPSAVDDRNGSTSCPATIAGMPAGSTISFVSLNVGDTSTSDTGVAGYLDNVVIRTGGNTDTFDFDPPADQPTGVETTRKVIADEDDLTGWDINNDFTTVFDFNDDQSVIGAGALSVGPIGNDINQVSGGFDKFISSHIVNVPTTDFESISFDVLVLDNAVNANTPADDANEFYLNVYTNMPGSTEFYECRFDLVGNAGDGLNNTTFTTLELLAADTPIVASNDGATCPASIDAMPAGSNVSFVSLNVGDTSVNDAGVQGYFDNVIVKAAGNTEIFDFDVDEIPVFVGVPDDVTAETVPGGTDAVVTFDLPAATDDISIPTVVCVPASGSTFPVGSTVVTCTATDSANQTAETTFNVTVTQIEVAPVDTPPTFDETPMDISATTEPGGSTAIVEFDTPVATDDDIATPATVECVPASGTAFEIGETVVTCTATDSIGQTAETMFTITVNPFSDLIAVDPARLLDTRGNGTNVTVDGDSQGDGPIIADGSVTVVVAGRGGIPADAIGAMVNIAAINPTGDGFVTLFPCSDEVPVTASLNYETEISISNATFVDLSVDGSVCVYSSNSTDLALDVVGYLPVTSRLGLVDPARILETRTGDTFTTIDGRSQGDGTIAAGNTVEVKVAGRAGVPDDAVAAMVNVAAVNPTDAGYITLYPCGSEQPLAASLNYTVDTNISNATLVELSSDGVLCVFTEDATDLTIDVVGFAPPGTDVGTINPGRFLETRIGDDKVTIDGESQGNGTVAASTFIEVPIAGRGDVPEEAISAIVNLAAVKPTDTGFVTLYPCSETPPLAASLNYTPDVNISNAILVDLSTDGSVCVFTSAEAHFTIDVLSYVLTDNT